MKMGKTLIVVVVLLIVALLVGSWFVGIRNQMVTKRETVNAAWSSVDIALQRRSDLIPNLVETVKGYAAQETTIFTEIAKARSALIGAKTPTDKIAANGALDSALSRLLVITENYPQLKSNENFLRLQDELAGTENRIAQERRSYNNTVQDYNTYIQLFPNSEKVECRSCNPARCCCSCGVPGRFGSPCLPAHLVGAGNSRSISAADNSP